MADSNTNITFKDSRWTFHATSNDSVKYEENLDRVTIHASSKQDWWKTAPGSVPESNVDRRTGPLYMLRHDSLGKQENWTAGVWLEGIEFKEVFQQAALFVGQGDTPESLTSWLKAGIELDGGEQKIGVVASNPYSDWSFHTSPHEVNRQEDGKNWKLYIEIKRTGADLILGYSLSQTLQDKPKITPMREVKGFITQVKPWLIGVMACGPQSEQTSGSFYNFSVTS